MALLVVTLAILPGCSGITYRRNPWPGVTIGHPAIGSETRVLLDAAGVGGHPMLHPGRTFAEAESKLLASPTPEGLLALAEMAAKRAAKAGPLDADGALRCHRDAAAYAALALADPRLDPGSPEGSRALALHNAGVAALLRRADRAGNPVERLIAAEVVVRAESPRIDPRAYRGLRAASDMNLGAFPIHGESGFGLPVVAEREFSEDEPRVGEEHFYAMRMSVPLTAMLRPRGPAAGAAWRNAPVELVLYDASLPRQVPLDEAGDLSRAVPLASDVTTPLVYRFANRNYENLRWAGLFLPDLASRQTGVYLLEPYAPEKIPVLLIHGLWSSPKTWLTMSNALRSDPDVRARYQFWYAFYPTGDPVLRSILDVRLSLRRVVRELDPSGKDPASRGIVLVGHSMGAVISRALLADTGERLERQLFNRPLDQVTLTPKTRQTLNEALLVRPEPGISRAILIAGPFRGSRVADASLGRFASGLIRPPGELTAIRQEILSLNGPEVLAPGRSQRLFNGVDNLEENSPVLTALVESPTVPGVPLHSIIPVRRPTARVESWSDGIVPYGSAHLDDAVSEVLVQNNHFCTANPSAIAEVARILRLHLWELDGSPAGAGSPIEEEPKDVRLPVPIAGSPFATPVSP